MATKSSYTKSRAKVRQVKFEPSDGSPNPVRFTMSSRHFCLTVALAVAGLMGLASCGGGGDSSDLSPSPAPPATAAPKVNLSASAASVTYGGDVTLTWSSTNATGCTAGGAWSGSKATGGTETVRPTEASSSFQLSCSGAGGKGEASTAVSVQALQTTLTPTTVNPTVTLGDLSVNFVGQTGVQNTLVTLRKFSDPTINSGAADDAGALETDLSSADIYRIELGAAPVGQVAVKLQTGTRYLASNRFPTIYYLSEAGEDSDGEFTAIASNLAATGDLTGSLPAEAFVATGPGRYEAILKIGLAQGYDEEATPTGALNPSVEKQQLSAQAAAASKATIPCPLAACTETSQFNPKRLIPQYAVPKPHKGTDFSAPAPGQALTGIAGSIVAGGKNDPTSPCGRHVILRAPTPRVQLKYCHLSAIDPDLLKDGAANGSIVIGATLPADNRIGTSGDTGGSSGHGYPYHLHLEMYRPSSLSCNQGICKYIFDKAESVWPHMVDTFKIKEIADKTLKKDGTYTIEIEATSIGGAPLKSDINTQMDNQVPGSPTRKICLTSNNQVSISYSTNPPELLKAGPAIDGDVAKCAPWGKPIKITASSNTPTTVVKARFSTRADLPLVADPLSDQVAEITLSGIGGAPTVEEFVDWSVNGVKIARSIPDRMLLLKDPFNGQPYLDLSAYKIAPSPTDTRPLDIDITVDNVAINGSTSITDSTADCLNIDLDRPFRLGRILLPNPLAEALVPGIFYVMSSCEYVTKYSKPAGTVSIETRIDPLQDDPTTIFNESGLQVTKGSFDFFVTDQEVAQIGGFALGDKRVTGTFQFKLGVCTKQFGCPLQ